MSHKQPRYLNPKKRYLQIALNSTLDEAYHIIRELPKSDRILLEAGTPLIKRYGEAGIRKIVSWWTQKLSTGYINDLASTETAPQNLQELFELVKTVAYSRGGEGTSQLNEEPFEELDRGTLPYVVADLKMMDRGSTEVEIAARAGARAAIALGLAPTESLDAFISACEARGLDAMIDMMNVEFPLAVLRKLKKLPTVVILHRGVDEEQFNKQKQLPLHEIRRIKGNYDIMVSIAGGDSIREVQRAIFNDADIVVVWKLFYQGSGETAQLAQEFLQELRQ